MVLNPASIIQCSKCMSEYPLMTGDHCFHIKCLDFFQGVLEVGNARFPMSIPRPERGKVYVKGKHDFSIRFIKAIVVMGVTGCIHGYQFD